MFKINVTPIVLAKVSNNKTVAIIDASIKQSKKLPDEKYKG